MVTTDTRRQKRFNNLCKDHKKRRDAHYYNNTAITENAIAYRKKRKPMEGDDVIKGILYTLTNLKTIHLYDFQLDFLKIVMITLLKWIYRAEWDVKANKVLKRNGLKRGTGYDEVFFTAARRMGKTLTLSFFCLATMLNVIKHEPRDYRIAIFSVSLESAKMFLSECINSWKELPPLIKNKFKIDITATQIKITRISNPEDVRVMKSYVGSGEVSFIFYPKRNMLFHDEKKTK